jgi:hypothetical protein
LGSIQSFAALATDGSKADKVAVGAKFLMSGSIPDAAFEAKSEKCHELPSVRYPAAS